VLERLLIPRDSLKEADHASSNWQQQHEPDAQLRQSLDTIQLRFVRAAMHGTMAAPAMPQPERRFLLTLPTAYVQLLQPCRVPALLGREALFQLLRETPKHGSLPEYAEGTSLAVLTLRNFSWLTVEQATSPGHTKQTSATHHLVSGTAVHLRVHASANVVHPNHALGATLQSACEAHQPFQSLVNQGPAGAFGNPKNARAIVPQPLSPAIALLAVGNINLSIAISQEANRTATEAGASELDALLFSSRRGVVSALAKAESFSAAAVPHSLALFGASVEEWRGGVASLSHNHGTMQAAEAHRCAEVFTGLLQQLSSVLQASGNPRGGDRKVKSAGPAAERSRASFYHRLVRD
jgi:hypothetical protein